MTSRLVDLAVRHWETLDGYAVAHNMPPLESLPLRRLCSYVWFMFTRNMEEQEVEDFRAKVWQPPIVATPEEQDALVADKRSPWNPENENSALGSLMSEFGMKDGPTQ